MDMAKQSTKAGNQSVVYYNDLGDGNNFDVSLSDIKSDGGGDNAVITTYIVGGACDVKLLIDSAGDFTSPDANITIDSFSGANIAEGANTPIQRNSVQLRITNTSGGSADFAVVATNREVDQV